jgi:hypothetical protein
MQWLFLFMARTTDAHIFICDKYLDDLNLDNDISNSPLLVIVIYLMKRFEISQQSALELLSEYLNIELRDLTESTINELSESLNHLNSFKYPYVYLDNQSDISLIKALRTKKTNDLPNGKSFVLKAREKNQNIAFYKNEKVIKNVNKYKKIKKEVPELKVDCSELDEKVVSIVKNNALLIRTVKHMLKPIDNDDLFTAITPILHQKKWPKLTESVFRSDITKVLSKFKSTDTMYDLVDKLAYLKLALKNRQKVRFKPIQFGSMNVVLLPISYAEKLNRFADEDKVTQVVAWIYCTNSGLNFMKMLDGYFSKHDVFNYSISMTKSDTSISFSISSSQRVPLTPEIIDVPYIKQLTKAQSTKKKTDWGYVSQSSIRGIGEGVPKKFQVELFFEAKHAVKINTASYSHYDDGRFNEFITLWKHHLNHLADLNPTDRDLYQADQY